MIDVSPELETFIGGKPSWQREQGKELALAITHLLGARLDLDEGAGEDWARVLADHKVAALVCMTGPLVVAVGDAPAEAIGSSDDVAADVPVIKVPEFDAVALKCDADVLRAAFGLSGHPALDPDAFAASDLWFSTV